MSRRVGSLKPSAYLVNIARGAVVDEQALIDALKTRKLSRSRARCFCRRAAAGGQPLVGFSQCDHHSAHRRLVGGLQRQMSGSI